MISQGSLAPAAAADAARHQGTRREIHNDEAYAVCLRLNREELLRDRKQPRSARRALRVEDKPGNVAVVIFADNIYKYIYLSGISRVRVPAPLAGG